MVFARIGRDIQSFLSGRDLVIFAIGIALSNEMQAALKTVIATMIMPIVSKLTGVDNLKDRAINLKGPGGKDLGIKLGWGAALQSLLVFFITLVIMVEIARYVTIHFVKSSSVQFV
jgi:large-conductance mechanosensitive channel